VIRIVFVIFLGVLWFLLSGHTASHLLALGALSVGLVWLISSRMGLIDREGFPIHLVLRWPRYLLWLGARIIESNIAVSRLILRPRMDIDPSRFTVKSSAQSEEGRVTYANSITLTPGTVTLGIDGAELEVHALTREAAEELGRGDMDRQVRRLESSV
jgi:multicomponent Na+:H+ antiporter subunit E